MSGVSLARPWLSFALEREMQVLSWAINQPGFVMARRIVWREVRNADLPKERDVAAWLAQELEAQKMQDAVAFLTSRDVSRFTDQSAKAGRTTARCIATVGLSNAERVGMRVNRQAQDRGTINIAVRLNTGLSRTALIEALSIATQARTAAVIDEGVPLPRGLATGTGTDCIAVAAPVGPGDYAGLHTDVGEALGAAVYRATLQGVTEWKSDSGSVQRG